MEWNDLLVGWSIDLTSHFGVWSGLAWRITAVSSEGVEKGTTFGSVDFETSSGKFTVGYIASYRKHTIRPSKSTL